MRKTLFQIIKTFKTFANNHKGIAQFEAKPITKNTADNYLYPLMWIQIKGHKIKRGHVLMNLNVNFTVRSTSKYDNFVKAESDTLELCLNFYAYFNDNLEKFGFVFEDETPVEPIEYQFADRVIGNMVSINIKVPFDQDEREIPIS